MTEWKRSRNISWIISGNRLVSLLSFDWSRNIYSICDIHLLPEVFMEKCQIVVVGSSGAGLPILSLIFKKMPLLHGCIILIQHMPIYINQAVRDNLASQTELTVKVAKQNDPIRPGFLYV